jgi:Mn2+/Fe2+ NRAMP family transporter
MFLGIFIVGFTKHLWQQISNMIMMMMLPDRLGLACGLGVLGGAFGPLYWGFLASGVINPDDESPTISRMEGKRQAHYFSYDTVAHNFTWFMIINTMVMAVVGVCVVPWMINPPMGEDSKLRRFLGRLNIFRRADEQDYSTEEP